MKTAFLFPGQGSQHVGMGKEFYDSFKAYQELVELAEDTLSIHLKKLMLEGPLDALTDTENTQPCLLTASFGIYKLLKESHPSSSCDVMAGHSLGEYSALVCADALSFTDALKLTHFRGKAMKKAANGSMAAVIGMEYGSLSQYLTEGCVIANDNCPGQLVISGLDESVNTVIDSAKKHGARLVKKLNVSGPFHSPWMKPAAEELERFIESIPVTPLTCAYYPNCTAESTTDHSNIKALLVQQITNPVRFRETLLNMRSKDNITHFYELGPQKVLAGLVKRTLPEAKVLSINTPHDIDEYVKQNEN